MTHRLSHIVLLMGLLLFGNYTTSFAQCEEWGEGAPVENHRAIGAGGSAVWTSGQTICLVGQLPIAYGGRLTIEPGVTVLRTVESGQIYCNGIVNILGESTAPVQFAEFDAGIGSATPYITFAFSPPPVAPPPGTRDTCFVRHCVFGNAKYGIVRPEAASWIEDNPTEINLKIEDCEFANIWEPIRWDIHSVHRGVNNYYDPTRLMVHRTSFVWSEELQGGSPPGDRIKGIQVRKTNTTRELWNRFDIRNCRFSREDGVYSSSDYYGIWLERGCDTSMTIAHCYFDLNSEGDGDWSNICPAYAQLWGTTPYGPRIFNNIFRSTGFAGSGVLDDSKFHGNIFWAGADLPGVQVPGDNFVNVLSENELYYDEQFHLYEVIEDDRVSGINQGIEPENEHWEDPDGSPLDIGLLGGPHAEPANAYYILEVEANQGAAGLGIPQGTCHVLGDEILSMSVDAISAGTRMLFAAGTGLLIDTHEPTLFLGTAGDSIILAGIDGAQWLGIERDRPGATVTPNVYTYCRISGADIGLRINAAISSITHCLVSDCGTGVLFESGATTRTPEMSDVVIENCELGVDFVGSDIGIEAALGPDLDIRYNGTGVRAILANLRLDEASVRHNSDAGLILSGSSADLSHCVIEYNGNGQDILHGGIGLVSGGNLRLKCTVITRNHGPGIGIAGGTLTMQDLTAAHSWGGNDISSNIWSAQVDIQQGLLQMYKGVNRVKVESMPPWPQYLVRYNYFLPGPVANVDTNAWGFDGGHGQDIISRLSPQQQFHTSTFDYIVDAEWEFCHEDEGGGGSTCEGYWGRGIAFLKSGEFSDAVEEFRYLIKNYPDCYLAKAAAEQLMTAQKLAGTSYSDIRAYYLAQVDSTSEDELKFALAKGAAEAAAFNHDFALALEELDSLKDVAPAQLDSIAVMYSSYAVNYLQAVNDTTDTLGHAAHYDTLMAHYDALMEFQFAGEVFKPTLEHTPPAPIAAAEDEVTLSADAYADDEVGIHQVLVDYRFWPGGDWEHDTLAYISGDSYSLDVALGDHGGGLEYRLLAIDSSGRIEAWPSTEGYPDLNDTLTNFVSFEPRVETLTSTAYIYAPGVLTHTIQVQDGGVVRILPSPDDDDHIVTIDEDVGIVLDWQESGALPQLLVEGTDTDPIILTCSDTTSTWSGIAADVSGHLEMKHATVRFADAPLRVTSGVETAVVRVDSCDFNHCASAIELTELTDSGADSSYVLHTDLMAFADDGLAVYGGALQLSDVTVQNCDSDGVILAGTDGLAMSDLTIADNGGAGLKLATGGSYEARLTNSTIRRNGGDTAEILISGGLLDISGGAGNVVQDSAGTLVSAYSEDGIDLELGSNSFQLLDTLDGRYVELAANSGGAYITGNFFGPVHVNDFTFVTEYLVPDTVNGWIYTYLRNESQMAEVIASPGDSLEFTTRAYLENLVGQLPGDSILEVGFKFKVLPDSTNWTTKRLYGKDADSLYNWWVKVGDDGGLINYIFWTRDTHGRFVTSPASADTSAPDNGPSHHTSFELNRTTIDDDSVTIWAPTVLTHNIDLGIRAKLVIKPWPGATDHTVTFAEGVYIELADYGEQAPHLWIEGTEAMPIRLTSESDSTDWDQIYIGGGTLTAEYTTFEGGTYTLQTISAELELDHCEFANSESFLYVEATGYVRNCVFRNMGEEYGFGSVAFGTGAIEVSDCWFYQNDGFGLYLYDHDGSVSGSNFMANTLGGLYGEDYLTNEVLSCSEFSYNGGDSTAEVTVNASTLHFSDGAACVFADQAGPLLSGTAMTSFDLAGGGNGFYLFDSSGTYISTGDETDTLDISGNYWYPFSPDTTAFWPLMDPDTSRFWQVDSTAVEVAECGGGSAAGMHAEHPRVVRPGSGDGAITGFHENGTSAVTLGRGNSKPVSTQLNSAAMASLKQADVARGNGDYTRAALLYRQFINEHPDHTLMVPALVGYFSSAKRAGSTNGLSAFFTEAATKLRTAPGRQAAHELSLKALILEGQPQAALNGYERLLENATNRRDSVRAVIAAMDIQLHHGQRERLLSAHPENAVTNFKEFARRAMALSAMVVHDRDGALDGPAVAAPIPTEYRLYQNFPNPFNPNTEIRFDLPEAVQVQLRIFNILGQQVAMLVDELRPAGAYNLHWDSKNASGATVASGVYVYQLKAGKFVDQKKMVLIR